VVNVVVEAKHGSLRTRSLGTFLLQKAGKRGARSAGLELQIRRSQVRVLPSASKIPANCEIFAESELPTRSSLGALTAIETELYAEIPGDYAPHASLSSASK
jgi:hypothetical protein